MSEDARQPLSEDTQAEDQRRCALCYHLFPKDEMYYVQIDEPRAWAWSCEGCWEKVQDYDQQNYQQDDQTDERRTEDAK